MFTDSCPRAWIHWPQLPLLGRSLALLALMVVCGVPWSLVPPILLQATPVLVVVVALLCWLGPSDVEVHLVRGKQAALLGFLACVVYRIVQVETDGRYLPLPSEVFLDTPSIIALVDVALATGVSAAVVESTPSSAGACSAMLRQLCTALGGQMSVQPGRGTLTSDLSGILSVVVWSRLCVYFHPTTLLPGETLDQLVRSPPASCVFIMMLLTAMIGFISTARMVAIQIHQALAPFPVLHRPYAVGLAGRPWFTITLEQLWGAQVLLLLAAMWSLHLSGAMALSCSLVMLGPRLK